MESSIKLPGCNINKISFFLYPYLKKERQEMTKSTPKRVIIYFQIIKTYTSKSYLRD